MVQTDRQVSQPSLRMRRGFTKNRLNTNPEEKRVRKKKLNSPMPTPYTVHQNTSSHDEYYVYYAFSAVTDMRHERSLECSLCGDRSQAVLRVLIVRLVIINILLILLPVQQHLLPAVDLGLPHLHHVSQRGWFQQQLQRVGLTGVLHLEDGGRGGRREGGTICISSSVLPGIHLDTSNRLLARVGRRGGRLERGEMES